MVVVVVVYVVVMVVVVVAIIVHKRPTNLPGGRNCSPRDDVRTQWYSQATHFAHTTNELGTPICRC